MKQKKWPAVVSFFVGISLTWLVLVGVHQNPWTSTKDTYLFNRVTRMIEKQNYEPVDSSAIYLSGVRGAVAGLQDPYAAYYTDEEYAKLWESWSGTYDGIGITYAMDGDGLFYVNTVYENSPAEEAGILEGDIIVAIYGERLEGQSLEYVAQLMKEHPDELVEITMQEGEEEVMYSLQPREIHIDRVHWKMIDESKSLLIRIDEFYGDCVEEVSQALDFGEKNGAESIILDLRDNPGGGLTESQGIAELLLDKGVLLSMRTRDGKEEFIYTSGDKKKTELPMVILMNEYSASASEMLAGALQDRIGAVVVGTQSYGKGIVQSTMKVPGADGYVKLTVAGYYTPNGNSIHKTGITPDVEINLPEESKEVSVGELEQEDDVQLQKAIEEAKKLEESKK